MTKGPTRSLSASSMAEVVTGVELTVSDVASVDAADLFAASGLVYAKSLD